MTHDSINLKFHTGQKDLPYAKRTQLRIHCLTEAKTPCSVEFASAAFYFKLNAVIRCPDTNPGSSTSASRKDYSDNALNFDQAICRALVLCVCERK